MTRWILTAGATALAFAADPAPARAQVIVTNGYAAPYAGGYSPSHLGYGPSYGGYAPNYGGYSPYGYGGYSPYGYGGTALPIGQGGLVQAGLNAAVGNNAFGSYQSYSGAYGSYPGYSGGYGSYQSFSRGYGSFQNYGGYSPYYGGSGYRFANPGPYSGGRSSYYYYGGGYGGRWR